MREGNSIHDELFDGDAVNVTVDEAVNLAGEEPEIQSIGLALPFFGSDVKKEHFVRASRSPGRTFYVVILSERAMLVVMDSVRNCLLFADSHRHVNSGALIAMTEQHSRVYTVV